jgi:hypothetical protein
MVEEIALFLVARKQKQREEGASVPIYSSKALSPNT